jgi:diguanylate cyclase
MDYQQSREQSAELLRIVVGLMGKQQAGFHPASYALWYEHAAGVNPSLSQELERHISDSAPLTDIDVRNLYTRHIVSRDRETIDRVEQRLAELLQETSQVISTSGVRFMQFSATLEGHATQLQQPTALESLQHILSELLAETQQMRVTNLTLTRQLDTSAQEVLTLTERLARAQVEALNDPLTRLLNRRGFEEVVSKLYDGSAPLAGASLLLIDIDEFKAINDTYGHLVGDQVLRAVAQILRARIKGADIACRLGGDEFAVLLPDTNVAGATALAEQIRTTLLQRRLRLVERNQFVENVTLSIGIANVAKEASLESLIQRADLALYAAKRSGRNRVSSAELTKPIT